MCQKLKLPPCKQLYTKNLNLLFYICECNMDIINIVFRYDGKSWTKLKETVTHCLRIGPPNKYEDSRVCTWHRVCIEWVD